MKKIIVICTTILLVCGITAGAYTYYEEKKMSKTPKNEDSLVKKEIEKIYNKENQENIASEIEQRKREETFTEDKMLLIQNPFGTNTLSAYVYFETEVPVKVSCRIHVEDATIPDFSQKLYADEDSYQTLHEYQLIGLIPDMENEVTFFLEAEDGTVTEKKQMIKAGSLLGEEEVKLDVEYGTSTEKQKDGLYVILGNDSEGLDFMYYYDNSGVLRGEVPIIGYRSHKILQNDDRMYYSISETKMAEVNRIGQVTNVYDLGKYKLHHDYVFDDEGNILILATDTEDESVEDRVLKLDAETGEVKEVLDLGDLFGSYKETCTVNEDGEMDWIHINTIQWLGDEEIILSSRETSTIIKISNLYHIPQIEYLIGEETFWKGTEFEQYSYQKAGDFPSQGGQHTVTYVEDAALPEGQYYLYMFNNNIGVSETRESFDWSVIEGVQSEAEEGTTSLFYKYLVDENNRTYTLVESFEVPYSGYVSSAQEIGDHTVIDSGFAGVFGEYDSNNELIAQFRIKKEKFVYRVFKMDTLF